MIHKHTQSINQSSISHYFAVRLKVDQLSRRTDHKIHDIHNNSHTTEDVSTVIYVDQIVGSQYCSVSVYL